MSAITITDWDALKKPVRIDEDDAAPCETCEELSTELAKAKALLKTIARLEAKPAKRESAEDDAATLEALGHAVFVTTIRTRIELFLKGRRA